MYGKLMSELISISKEEYENLKEEVSMLRNTRLYKRLLEFEENLRNGNIFTRKDLGF